MVKLLILYASQTGYAEETAERIKREARQRYLNVELVSMHHYQYTELPKEELVAFVCSVTGQGQEPDTMKVVNLLTFNFPAKKLHKRLIQLGGQPLVPRGDGDDQHYLGVDGALDPWLKSWREAVLKMYPLPVGVEPIPDSVLPKNNFVIKILPRSAEKVEPAKRGKINAVISANKRITTPSHFQDVRHFEFVANEPFAYEPGDTAVIYPQNDVDEVNKALEYLGWEEIADNLIEISSNGDDVKVPEQLLTPMTIRDLFVYHLDIFGRPRRYFFQLLSFFATNELQKEKLVEFSSAEGQMDLYAYAHRPRRTIFEVLEDFSSVKVPILYLLDLIPLMKPRYFSIASAASIDRNTLHLTVAIVTYKTNLQKLRKGVCTTWLSFLKSGDEIQFDIVPGTFKLPQSPSVPIVCIGPGTGVAPMRSIIRHRTHQSTAKCILFFGCRNSTGDYYYQDEWDALSNKSNFEIISAFSRDQEDKIYVQHRIREHGQQLWGLLEAGCFIYLAGNAKNMPDQVMEAFIEIIMQYGNMDEAAAQEYFKRLEKSNRFQQECWS